MNTQTGIAEIDQHTQIHYQSQGNGFPLICIMGLNGTSKLWNPSFLGPLAERYRVITFDNRGVGGSTGPGPISIATFARDTVKLLDHLGLDKAHIFGISMGGMIAQQIAVSYPSRIAKLILGATTCAAKYVRPSLGVYSLLLLPVAPRFALSAVFSPEFLRKNNERIPDMLTSFKHGVGSLKVARQQLQACKQFDVADAVEALPHETLVITGTADRIINPENSEIIAGKIRGAKLIQLAGAGHAFLAEEEQATLNAFFHHLG